MPQSKAHVYRHKWQEDGSCSGFSSCQRINLAKAYENGYLEIEGLEGRTYDSYPQILSKITWKSRRGDSKELTAPIYQHNNWPTDRWKPLGVGGEEPLFSGAGYTVVYKNNTNPYPYAPDDEGFDPDKAPQVKISGYGSYYCGSFTVYFTIGEGEMHLGDFEVLSNIIYNGMPHKAWDKNAVEYKVDAADRGQFTQLGADEMYIPACDRTNATNTWFGDDWENPTQIEYSTDGGQTWNVEMAYGREGDTEHAYMITNAGEYPFYIKVTNKVCGELVSGELVAKITPRSLDSNGITFDKSASVTAYFTGYGIQIKENWWRKLINTVSFGLFYNDKTQDVNIKAYDVVSGIKEYYCYIQKISDDAASGEVPVKNTNELDAIMTGATDIYSGFVSAGSD